MSFQDVVRSTPSRTRSDIPRSQSSISDNLSTAAILDTPNNNEGPGGEICRNGSSGIYAVDIREVSEEMLQYQREVGRLPSALHSVTAPIGSSDEWKLKLQFDGVRKLGEQISLHLSTCEENLKYVQRHKAADSRAAILKLTRDFRRIETIFKNLEMEFKKKSADRSKRTNSYEANIRPHPDQRRNDEETRELQLRMEEQDRLNEEIMRLREAEVIEINRKMHQVNEIYKVRFLVADQVVNALFRNRVTILFKCSFLFYSTTKDLGELVNNQQEQIDQVEIDMEAAAINTKSGLTQLEAANKNSDRTFTNPFRKAQNGKNSADGDQASSGVSASTANEGCSWSSPFESLMAGFSQISEEMNGLQRKMTVVFTLGNSRCCPSK
jgi:hypothetical protein